MQMVCMGCYLSVGFDQFIFLPSVYTRSEKTSIYATLVGILNAKKFDFGEEVWYDSECGRVPGER